MAEDQDIAEDRYISSKIILFCQVFEDLFDLQTKLLIINDV